jgi:hypothetical protein
MDAKNDVVQSRGVKRLCFVAAVLAACQSGEKGKPPVPKGYAADIGKICDVVRLADADKDPGARQLTIAMWLGGNLETSEARQFLVSIQPLQGTAKADALVAEAKRNGLDDCALAAEWRQ